MANATDYLNSNYYRAEELEPGVLIETTIVSTRGVEFDDGAKLAVYTDNGGKGFVCNQTRLKALIGAFGANLDNWRDKPIVVSRGETLYAGKAVPCIVIEPVVATRIGAEKRPVIEGPQRQPRGSTDIRSGKGAWDGPKRGWDGAPEPDSAQSGPNDDIPF
jgi:hypothetical protein